MQKDLPSQDLILLIRDLCFLMPDGTYDVEKPVDDVTLGEIRTVLFEAGYVDLATRRVEDLRAGVAALDRAHRGTRYVLGRHAPINEQILGMCEDKILSTEDNGKPLLFASESAARAYFAEKSPASMDDARAFVRLANTYELENGVPV